ncbi:MAG: hypothetical protein BECKG1743F_GA0114225_100871, partial [Candidatus Kentron sp. G]
GLLQTEQGGEIRLEGNTVTNRGSIRADESEVTLTAGPADDPDSGNVSNEGTIEAGGPDGRIYLEGGTVTNTGTLSVAGDDTEDGGEIHIDGGSVTLGGDIGADGANGGIIEVRSRSTLSLLVQVHARGLGSGDGASDGIGGTVSYYAGGTFIENSGSTIDVSGLRDGGTISVEADTLLSYGHYLAEGETGLGGRIDLTATEEITLISATLDASGETQGGLIRVGGAFQGGKTTDPNTPDLDRFVDRWAILTQIRNARRTLIDEKTTLDVSANGGAPGAEGGTVIVWSDEQTTMVGFIDARGGSGGAGGVVEISSSELLTHIDLLNVTIGEGGSLLLDPKDIVVSDTGSDPVSDAVYATRESESLTIVSSDITAILDAGTAVTLQASNDITVDTNIVTDNTGGDGGDLTLQAGRSLLLNASIVTDNGNLTLIANDTTAGGVVDAQRDAGDAVITMIDGTSIDAGTGTVDIQLRDGAGKTNTDSGDITLQNITAYTITVVNEGPTEGSGIVLDGTLTASVTSGDGIVLAGDTFTNNTGESALAVEEDARWLVWSGDPSNDVRGLTAHDAVEDVSALVLTGFTGFFLSTEDGFSESGGVLSGPNGFTAPSDEFVQVVNGMVDGVSILNTDTYAYLDSSFNGFIVSKVWWYTGGGPGVGMTPSLVWPASTAYDFKQYNATYGVTTVAGTGNGFLYTLNPTVTPGLTGTITKIYDSTDSATLTADNYTTAGVVDDDVVTLNNPTSGTYDDKNAGTGKTVTVDSISIVSAISSAADGSVSVYGYELASTTVSSNIGAITQKSINPANIVPNSKVYDGTDTASLNLDSAGLITGAANDTDGKYYTGDSVVLVTTGATGLFPDKHVENDKLITVIGLSLSGDDADNYSITGGSEFSASITAKPITATDIAAADKVYDSTTTASLSGGTITDGSTTDTDNLYITGDDVALVDTSGATGSFADEHVGTHAITITGLTLSGTDAGNYTVTDDSGASATISTKAITATGIAAADKVYDSTTTASVSGGGITGGSTADDDNLYITNDDVALVDTSGATGTFADEHVGIHAVTITGLTLSGTDAENYTITDASNASATISVKALIATGITAAGKVYDSTNVASLSGGTITGGSTTDTDNLFITGDNVTLVDTSGATGTFASEHVGDDQNVTITGLTLSGDDAGNYTITDASSATASISAKAITATGIDAADKVYDSTTTASLSGGVISGGSTSDTDNLFITGDSVSLVDTSGATGTFADEHVGTRGVTITGLSLSGDDAGNYTITDASNASATISTKAITATGINAADKVYDSTTTASLSGGVISGGSTSDTDNLFITGDSVSLVDTSGATGTFADEHVGTRGVTITGLSLSGDDAGNYTITDASGASAEITARPVTINVDAFTKVYDGTLDATGATASVDSGTPLATGDGALSTGTYVFNDANVGVGTTVSTTDIKVDDGNSGNNYDYTYVANTASSISAKAITATGITAADKVYDSTITASLSGGVISGGSTSDTDNLFITGDSVSLVDTSGATGTFAGEHVGTHAVTITDLALSGTDAGNYTITDASNASATISKKAITATAIAAANKVYDSDDVASLSGGTITDGSTADNDNLFIDGDNVALDIGTATGTFADEHVGTHDVTITGLSLTGDDAVNYTITDASGASATISKKAITATAIAAADKVYDSDDVASLSGGTITDGSTADDDNLYITNDDVALVDTSGATGTFADEHVGTHAVTITGLTLSGTDAGNYTITDASGASATISKKAITATAIAAADKVYDAGTDADLVFDSATLTGGATVDDDNKYYSGDTLSLVTTSAVGAFGDKNVGAGKAVTVTGLGLSGDDAGNYTITDASGATATISPASLSINGTTADNRVYDATTDATVTAGTLSGVITGDTVTVTGTGTFDNKNVGTDKTVTNSYTLGGIDGGNYTLADDTTIATITAKAVDISGSRAYDGTTDVLADIFTVTTGIEGEALTLTGAGTVGSEDVGAGSQTVTLGTLALDDGAGGDAGNYTLTGGTHTVTVTALALSISGTTAANKAYDATTDATVTVGTLAGVLGSDDVTVTGTGTFDNKNVGTGKTVTNSYTLGGIDSGNYTLADDTASADITAIALSISGTSAADKVYDANTVATVTEGTLSGVISGDAVTVTGIGAFDTKDVGTNKTVTVGYILGDADGGNYTLADDITSADITPKTIAASGITASDKIYDGAVSASTAAPKFGYPLCGYRFALISPFEGFSHSCV